MRYSLGECVADFGFHFFEKIHEPIFLVNRVGSLLKINEAGRKLLRVMGKNQMELELYLKSSIVSLFKGLEGAYKRIPVGNRRHLIARSFPGSDFILVELS